MGIFLICGHVFDGVGDTLLGRTEILIEDDTIAAMGPTVPGTALVEIVDLTHHTVMPKLVAPGLVPLNGGWRELYLLVQSGIAAVRVLQAATSSAALLMGK